MTLTKISLFDDLLRGKYDVASDSADEKTIKKLKEK